MEEKNKSFLLQNYVVSPTIFCTITTKKTTPKGWSFLCWLSKLFSLLSGSSLSGGSLLGSGSSLLALLAVGLLSARISLLALLAACGSLGSLNSSSLSLGSGLGSVTCAANHSYGSQYNENLFHSICDLIVIITAKIDIRCEKAIKKRTFFVKKSDSLL